jgi:hypothetical protein
MDFLRHLSVAAAGERNVHPSAVQAASRKSQLGYGMSIPHPATTGCDFLFEDLEQAATP